MLRNSWFLKYFSINTDTSYIIPDIVTKIDSGAITNNSYLQNLTLSETITYIGYESFNKCSNLKSINVPSGVYFVGVGFIQYSSVENISMNGTELENYVLRHMSKLKKVTFTNTVKKVYSLFNNIPLLETVIFESTTPPTFTSATLHSGTTPNTFKIYVPDSAVATYKAVANLAAYKDRIFGISEMP